MFGRLPCQPTPSAHGEEAAAAVREAGGARLYHQEHRQGHRELAHTLQEANNRTVWESEALKRDDWGSELFARSFQTEEVYTLSSADERGEKIKVAAIDNGLAFPFKHPDEWRACESELLIVELLSSSFPIILYA